MTVTALDDYTVRCVLPVSFAPFLRSMGTAIYPKHILEPYVDDGTFNEVWDIGTGPGRSYRHRSLYHRALCSRRSLGPESQPELLAQG